VSGNLLVEAYPLPWSPLFCDPAICLELVSHGVDPRLQL